MVLALYSLMNGIHTFEKLHDTKKQLNDTWMQIQTANIFLTPKLMC